MVMVNGDGDGDGKWTRREGALVGAGKDKSYQNSYNHLVSVIGHISGSRHLLRCWGQSHQ